MATSRAHDKKTTLAMKQRLRWLVIASFSLMSLLVVFSTVFLTVETLRAARASRRAAGDPDAETPISSRDPGWLRRQVFQMSMIVAVVVGTFGLLAVLVMYLRWQIG
jgi:hypothetical protein